ncbi:hypothetical protein HELRODRAFT_184578 [Helobdella robusta]|uniref:Ig-like domain-containing protein n=1 Tax=Helobdella robusta TaxID=6412 RepID=T1FLI6_HELRO|nr:hypothetical protein HELRODRAFT_184578 [Helobdella robusta]ESO09649.1 hypothetical protein HELRODRAFT_184578 [Helobdella robusta]
MREVCIVCFVVCSGVYLARNVTKKPPLSACTNPCNNITTVYFNEHLIFLTQQNSQTACNPNNLATLPTADLHDVTNSLQLHELIQFLHQKSDILLNELTLALPTPPGSDVDSFEQYELGSSCLLRCNVSHRSVKEKGNISWSFNEKQIVPASIKFTQKHTAAVVSYCNRSFESVENDPLVDPPS